MKTKERSYVEALDIANNIERMVMSGQMRSWNSTLTMRHCGFVAGWVSAGGPVDDPLFEMIVESLETTLSRMRQKVGVA